MILHALAPAKVNLFLHVGAPEASGYHPICSLMVFADIGDELTGEAAATLSLEVAGPFGAGLARDGDNLVLRAARAVLAQSRSAAGARLTLDKHLPVASGLGGGSSDAGAAFRLMRALIQADLSDDMLESMAADLGADGAACFRAQSVIAEGRGERLSPASALPPLPAVLVNAGSAVSTPGVYRRFDERGRFGEVARPVVPMLQDAADVAGWLSNLRNDLQAAAIDVQPEVGEVLELLSAQPETLLARVSGSGGTCFALCADDCAAKALAARLAAMRPDWWVRACRLG